MTQGSEIQPLEVFRVLNSAKLKAVLVGAHAVNARTARPRATLDIDLVAEKPSRVAEVLALQYPHLKMQDDPVVIRFKHEQREAIDIIKPQSSPLFARVLKCTEQLVVQNVVITIPDVEAIVALKFASMISPTRRIEDKYADGRDFIMIVKAAAALNEHKLAELGELVYTGATKELLKHVADARAGRRLEF
jgi:hypothetical protein